MEPTAASRSSTDRRACRVPIGRVVGAHGLRGGVRVRSFTGSVDGLLGLTRVALGRGEDDPDPRPFELRAVAAGRRGELRMDLEGVRTRDDALAHKGLWVFADETELPALGPGEYYGHELLGCRVEGEDGRVVGRVREIWETGGSDLLVVRDDAGREHLLPAALLRRVDRRDRRIVVEILPGLLVGE